MKSQETRVIRRRRWSASRECEQVDTRGHGSRVTDSSIDPCCSFIAQPCQFSALATLALELYQ